MNTKVMDTVDKDLMNKIIDTVVSTKAIRLNVTDLNNLISLYQHYDNELRKYSWFETGDIEEVLKDFSTIELLNFDTTYFNEIKPFHVLKEKDNHYEIVSYTNSDFENYIMRHCVEILSTAVADFMWLQDELCLQKDFFSDGFIDSLECIYNLYLDFEKLIYKLD